MRALALLVLVWATPALAQMVVVMSRSGYVREARNSSSADCYHAQAGDSLLLLDEDFANGYYHVQASNGCEGFVYRSLGRRPPVSDPPVWAGGGSTPGPTALGTGPRWLNACSFNMRFPGSGDNKQYAAMVEMLEDYQLVLVQELVAAPVATNYNGVSLQPSAGSTEFFGLMEDAGFSWALSEGKTGQTSNTTNGNSSEYFVAFYKDDVLQYERARSGFIDTKLVGNTVFSRVPWKFHFKTVDGTLDFTAINVHLKPTQGNAAKRRLELAAVARHADADPERDQLIIGDMNFYSCTEMNAALPAGYASLNAACAATNIAEIGRYPYDHVMYRPTDSGNDIATDHFEVLDLQKLMKPKWSLPGPYPTVPPKLPAQYGSYFSDHNPIEFKLRYGVRDDDN